MSVEVSANVQLDVDHIEGFDVESELRVRAPHSLGDCPNDAVLRREQPNDAVRLCELMGAQHDRFIPVGSYHPRIVAPLRPQRAQAPLLMKNAGMVQEMSRAAMPFM